MKKIGKVEAGVTPSEQSGKKSDKIVQGQALTKEETPKEKSIEKASSLLDT